VSFEPYLEEYLERLAAAGYSKGTLKGRRECLNRFFQGMAEKGIYEPRDVTRGMVDEYFSDLKKYRTAKGTPLAGSTYSRHIGAVDGFFRWLAKTNQILISPVANRPVIRSKRRLPQVLTEDEILKILESCPFNTPAGLRDRAMLELLYSTGIRVGELTAANVEDFIMDRRELVIVQGKGRKDRIAPVGEYAARFTESYLKMIRPWQAQADEKALFVCTRTGKRLSAQTVRSAIGYALDRSGINRPVTPHLFRHSMATHLLRNGADLRHIQAILGHVSLRITEVYTHLNLNDLKQTVKKAHPHGQRAAKKNDSG
jgi:integrase/recombinase XerD